MDPTSAAMYLSSSTSSSYSIGHSNPLPQGSKLATYMRGYQTPTTSLSNGSNLNESKSVESNFKKLSISGIPEFVPSTSNGGYYGGGGGGSGGGGGGSGGGSSSSVGGGSGGGEYNDVTAAASVYSTSPRDSPVPQTEDSSTIPPCFNEGGTTYFYSDELAGPPPNPMLTGANSASGSVLMPNYSVYTGTPSYVANLRVRANMPSILKDNELKLELLKRQQICQSQVDPEAFPNHPTEVDNFQQITPLEPPPVNPLHKSHTFGYVTSVYKATNVKTGQYVCLRRIHGFRLVNTKCMILVEQWKKLQHSNMVSLRQVFTTKCFGDQSMVFVYDFYPGAETLMTKQFHNHISGYVDPFSDGARPYSQLKTSSSMLRHQQQSLVSSNDGPIAESLIWTYIIQLTSALRHIHSAGLAYRTLDPTKILVINKNRLLLNCGGIFDVLTFDPNANNPMAAMAHFQQEDLISLGKIVLALACNSFMAIQRENLQSSMELVTSTYSSDLRNLIMYLLTNPTRVKSVNDLMPMIGARFYTQLDAAYIRNDQIEAELSKDVESSRLFRLLTKLSTVVDRAELNNDYEWAEYGDRYMLKLFRDYVFHQVMENDRPWLDMSHVISCLNKLDAGVPDKVCLMSRDEQNVLVVSYQELKRCLEQSFNECLSASSPKPNATYQ